MGRLWLSQSLLWQSSRRPPPQGQDPAEPQDAQVASVCTLQPTCVALEILMTSTVPCPTCLLFKRISEPNLPHP